MLRTPVLWVVACEVHSPGDTLTALQAELDKREASGTLTHKLVHVQEMTMAVLDSQLRLFVNGVEQIKLPQIALIYLPGNAIRNSQLLSAVRHLEDMGIRCFNSSEALAWGSDKFGLFRRLASHGLPVLDTASIVTPLETALPHLLSSQHGIGFPAILKSNTGSMDKNEVLLPNSDLLEDIAPSLNDDVFLLQRYLGERHGRHVRVMIVAGQVNAYARITNSHNTRVQSIVNLGGVFELIGVEDKDGLETLGQLSVKIATLTGCDYGAFDFEKGPNGQWLFLELHACPDLSEFKSAVSDLIDYMVSHVKVLTTQSP